MMRLHYCNSLQVFAPSWLSAVSSSPRPWIDVFALPEEFNMAVTGGISKPRSEK